MYMHRHYASLDQEPGDWTQAILRLGYSHIFFHYRSTAGEGLTENTLLHET